MTFDLWPWPCNLSEILSRSIPPLNLESVRSTVQPGERWQTDRQTHTHRRDRFHTLNRWRRREREEGDGKNVDKCRNFSWLENQTDLFLVTCRIIMTIIHQSNHAVCRPQPAFTSSKYTNPANQHSHLHTRLPFSVHPQGLLPRGSIRPL